MGSIVRGREAGKEVARGTPTQEDGARDTLTKGAKAERLRTGGAVTEVGKAERAGPGCVSACGEKPPCL